MKTYSITAGRKKLGDIVDQVKYQGVTIGLGARGKVEVLIVPVTNRNFSFLEDEPDLYSRSDVRRNATKRNTNSPYNSKLTQHATERKLKRLQQSRNKVASSRRF